MHPLDSRLLSILSHLLIASTICTEAAGVHGNACAKRRAMASVSASAGEGCWPQWCESSFAWDVWGLIKLCASEA